MKKKRKSTSSSQTKAQEVLGPPIGYIDILDVYLSERALQEEVDIKEGRPKYNPIRPSASGKCTRELAFALMEYLGKDYYEKDVRPPEVTRLLSLGHSIEDNYLAHFEAVPEELFTIRYQQQTVDGFSIESEEDRLNQLVEGSMDLVFWSDEYKCLADVKSKKDKFSRHFKTHWDETDDKLKNMDMVELIGESDKAYWITDLDAFLEKLDDPFWEMNFVQLNFYANTDWAQKRGIDHCALLYYNKNDSRHREIRFKPSKTIFEKTQKKFETASLAASKGDPFEAPRDHVLGSIKCAFCSYKNHCWPNKDAKGAFFDTFPNKKWPQDVKKMGKDGAIIADYFAKFKQGKKVQSEIDKAEEMIIDRMLKNNVNKIKLEDGTVYQIKLLKSPHERYVLRRTKL